MSDRIATQMSELMNDLYVAFEDPQAILNPAPVADDAPEVEAYGVTVPSASKGTKTYTAATLSADPARNVQLLAIALQDLAKATDAAKRDAIKAFARAIIDSL